MYKFYHEVYCSNLVLNPESGALGLYYAFLHKQIPAVTQPVVVTSTHSVHVCIFKDEHQVAVLYFCHAEITGFIPDLNSKCDRFFRNSQCCVS
jgi:hypothetical protein